MTVAEAQSQIAARKEKRSARRFGSVADPIEHETEDGDWHAENGFTDRRTVWKVEVSSEREGSGTYYVKADDDFRAAAIAARRFGVSRLAIARKMAEFRVSEQITSGSWNYVATY